MSRVVAVPYPSGVTPPTPNTLLQDAFVGTNGTDLASHTPDVGGPWVNWGGSIQIQSDTAKIITDGTYVADCGQAEISIAARIKCGAANGNFAPTVVFRGTDSTHYLIIYFSGDGNLQLYWRNGSFSLIDTTTWSADANWHDVVVATDGTNITVTIDGGAPWNTACLQQAAGTFCGIRGFTSGGNSDSFESIEVTGFTPSVFPAPFSTPIDSENFNQANGTTLASLGWTEGNGTWTCESNQAEQALTGAPVNGYTAYRNEATGDCAIEATFVTASSGQLIGGLCFRVQDSSHYIELELNTSGAYSPQKGFGCWYFNGGVSYAELMTSAFVPAANTAYTLRVTLSGTRIICECVEAGLRMECDSSQFQTETEHGLFEYRDGTRLNPNHWDDFVVYG